MVRHALHSHPEHHFEHVQEACDSGRCHSSGANLRDDGLAVQQDQYPSDQCGRVPAKRQRKRQRPLGTQLQLRTWATTNCLKTNKLDFGQLIRIESLFLQKI